MDGFEEADNFLEHYGVKGMKWGVRKDRSLHDALFRAKAQEKVKVKTTVTPGKKIKTSGGTGQDASPDAIRAAIAKQKATKSSTDALSNKELQDLVSRMNLEQQYARLNPEKQSFGKAFVGTALDVANDLGPDIALNKIQGKYGSSSDPEDQKIAEAAQVLGKVLKSAKKSKKK